MGAVTMELHRLKRAVVPDASLAPAALALRESLPEEFRREKKYEIGGVVAEGGMGMILDVREANIERTVAMKMMLDGSSPDDLLRFVAEAKVTGQLEHPCIVPVYELGVDENEQVFYTMKFVRGITLRKVLDLMAAGTEETIRQYPLGAMLTIFQKVCDAIAFAHSKGVIHRDLKPENIMLGDFGEVLVMDWGLAKVLPSRASSEPRTGTLQSVAQTLLRARRVDTATMTGSIMGTPQYMAPEQARGEVETLDGRADIYALGAILYHILALRPSVTGDNPHAVTEKVGRGEIDPLVVMARRGFAGARRGGPPFLLHLVDGAIPDSLVAVVRKAMALQPAGRYQSVTGLQEDISAYQNGFATTAENAGVARQIALLVKRHKALFGTAAGAWLIITALAVWFVLNLRASERRAVAERARAEATLADLRRTAPTFYAEGRSLAEEQKFADALQKISFAASIEPGNTLYQLSEAHLLQEFLRFDEAERAYARVLALDQGNKSAAENRVLCQRLIAAQQRTGELGVETLGEFLRSMQSQGRMTELMRVSGKHLRSTTPFVEMYEAVLKKLQQTGALPADSQAAHLDFNLYGDGRISARFKPGVISDLSLFAGLPISGLNMSDSPAPVDLSPLAGTPLDHLSVKNCHITDISPLRSTPLLVLVLGVNPEFEDLTPLQGMKLRELMIYNTNVADLTPLMGMPLTYLNLSWTKVTDLHPIKGQSLKFLSIIGAPVSDLGPLKGSSITELHMEKTLVRDLSPLYRMFSLTTLWCAGCRNLNDLRPIAECNLLQELTFPEECKDIGFLRQMPALRRLSSKPSTQSGAGYGWDPTPSAADFWKEYDARQAAEGK
jgi:serine/threonine protein kinase